MTFQSMPINTIKLIPIKKIEKKFNEKKVVTFVRKFEKFYPAENYHQDYYQESFINYLIYKKACGREEQLQRIWQ